MTDERKEFTNALIWVRALNNANASQKGIIKFKSELIASEKHTPEIQEMATSVNF